MKTTSISTFVFIDVDVEIGPLKVVVEVQAIVYKNKDGEYGVDIDIIDWSDSTFNQMKIENWRKFNEHHIAMGINYNKAINKAVMEQFTDAVKTLLIKTYKPNN